MDQLGVSFGINSEINVREAFSLHAEEIGFTIKRSRDKFPDYKLENEAGQEILAEAEVYARDFIDHRHDIDNCDLILCWYDNLPVNVLPTLEIGEKISTPNGPSKPNEFVSVYDPGTHIKTIEMSKDTDDTLNFRFGWYLRQNETIAHKSPNTPTLNESEFEKLFKGIDRSVREEAFVDINFDKLIDWHESLSDNEKFRSDRKGRMLCHIDQGEEGEIVLKLMDESNIQITRYLSNGTQHPNSQNAATIDKQAYRGILSPIPREIREQVFLDLNLGALWRWHHY
jgi:hypothetical protein